MEELYLYLKEQVASGREMEYLVDEMHERVYSLVSSARANDVVSTLLDMHILEDEQYIVKQRINFLAGIETAPTMLEQAADEAGRVISDEVLVSAEGRKDQRMNSQDSSALQDLKFRHKTSLQVC